MSRGCIRLAAGAVAAGLLFGAYVCAYTATSQHVEQPYTDSNIYELCREEGEVIYHQDREKYFQRIDDGDRMTFNIGIWTLSDGEKEITIYGESHVAPAGFYDELLDQITDHDKQYFEGVMPGTWKTSWHPYRWILDMSIESYEQTEESITVSNLKQLSPHNTELNGEYTDISFDDICHDLDSPADVFYFWNQYVLLTVLKPFIDLEDITGMDTADKVLTNFTFIHDSFETVYYPFETLVCTRNDVYLDALTGSQYLDNAINVGLLHVPDLVNSLLNQGYVVTDHHYITIADFDIDDEGNVVLVGS